MANAYHDRMVRVLDHIHENLDRDLSLKELADVAHFSLSHFHRVFRGMLGESLKEHVRRLRLERAALRLMTTDRIVTELALEAGFETPETFSRAFKAMFGQPPTEYRTAPRLRVWPPSPSGVHYVEDETSSSGLQHIGGKSMTMDLQVEIRTFDTVQTVSVRHVGPYTECGRAWEALCRWAGPKGILGPNMQAIGLCWDDPAVTPPDKLRCDACIVVPERIEGEGEVQPRELPGGEFAVTLHKGSYMNLHKTYEALFGQWLPQSGREFAEAPSREVYLNDPTTTPEDELLTEIRILLK